MFLSTLCEITEWPKLTQVVIFIDGRVRMRKVLNRTCPHGLNGDKDSGTHRLPLNPVVNLPLHFGKLN